MHYYYNSVSSKNPSKPSGNMLLHRKRMVRFIFLVMLVSISFMLGTLVQVFASSDTEPGDIDDIHYGKMVVDIQQGDTIWGIAQQYAPEHVDIRQYVHQIIRLNQLESPIIYVGQSLILP